MQERAGDCFRPCQPPTANKKKSGSFRCRVATAAAVPPGYWAGVTVTGVTLMKRPRSPLSVNWTMPSILAKSV